MGSSAMRAAPHFQANRTATPSLQQQDGRASAGRMRVWVSCGGYGQRPTAPTGATHRLQPFPANRLSSQDPRACAQKGPPRQPEDERQRAEFNRDRWMRAVLRSIAFAHVERWAGRLRHGGFHQRRLETRQAKSGRHASCAPTQLARCVGTSSRPMQGCPALRRRIGARLPGREWNATSDACRAGRSAIASIMLYAFMAPLSE